MNVHKAYPDVQRTFCRLCPTSCGLTLEIEGTRIIRVRGDKNHPLSAGYACSKGLAAGEAHHSPKRLNYPLVRTNGVLHRTDWSSALDLIADKLNAIRASAGPDAIGFYTGTAGFFDTGAVLARTFSSHLGTSSWYTSTSVDAPGWLLVAERMTGNPWLWPQPDRDADLTIIVGWNPIISHGHNYYISAPKMQLRTWAGRNGLWVIDPRKTETAAMATDYMQARPGSEYILFGFLISSLLKAGADQTFLATHCQNIDVLAKAVSGFTLELAAAAMDVPAEQIQRLLDDIRRTGRIAVHSGTGISMSPHANITTWLIWSLLAVTGSLDRPRGAWFNRGMMRDLDALEWKTTNMSGPGPRSRPDLPSRCGEMPAGALADEIEASNLKALIVIGGNPIIALPDAERLIVALGQLDLLVVLDVVPTGTTELASHVLPCAGQFERSDISLSEIIYPSEYTQYTPAILPLEAERKPVWWILGQIAKRMGFDIAPDDLTEKSEMSVVRAIPQKPRFNVDKLYEGEASGIMMPKRSWGWVTRHLNNGRWNLGPQEFVEQLNKTVMNQVSSGGLILLSGRQRYKINSTMNDGLADRHNQDQAGLFIHPDDAARWGLIDGAIAKVTSASGALELTVHIDLHLRPGCVRIPHGFEGANVGNLTTSNINADLLSGMIQQTGLEVRVEKVRD